MTVSNESEGSDSGVSALEKINARISGCTACALSESRTRTVPGEGSPSAEIMFIGEGPGQSEDEQGRPFVGRAGKLLDELIGSIPMRRQDVFIANMVKCRPPGNRNPDASEMDACSGYLDSQLAAIDPVLIVTLGSVPLTRFAPGSKVTAIRGKAFEYEGRWLLPTFHPAFALRNPDAVELMRADFKTIPEALLKGIEVRMARESGGSEIPESGIPMAEEKDVKGEEGSGDVEEAAEDVQPVAEVPVGPDEKPSGQVSLM